MRVSSFLKFIRMIEQKLNLPVSLSNICLFELIGQFLSLNSDVKLIKCS